MRTRSNGACSHRNRLDFLGRRGGCSNSEGFLQPDEGVVRLHFPKIKLTEPCLGESTPGSPQPSPGLPCPLQAGTYLSA